MSEFCPPHEKQFVHPHHPARIQVLLFLLPSPIQFKMQAKKSSQNIHPNMAIKWDKLTNKFYV